MESLASLRHGQGLTTSTLWRPRLLLNWNCAIPHLALPVYACVVVSVAVVFIMGAVIVLATEDSSHSLARGWRARSESPIRYKKLIIYLSGWCLGAAMGPKARTLTSRGLPLENCWNKQLKKNVAVGVSYSEKANTNHQTNH